MGFIFLISLILLGQETIFVALFMDIINQPILNYNNVEGIFEENSPPILAYTNSLLPDSAELTEALTSLYLETVNEEGE